MPLLHTAHIWALSRCSHYIHIFTLLYFNARVCVCVCVPRRAGGWRWQLPWWNSIHYWVDSRYPATVSHWRNEDWVWVWSPVQWSHTTPADNLRYCDCWHFYTTNHRSLNCQCLNSLTCCVMSLKDLTYWLYCCIYRVAQNKWEPIFYDSLIVDLTEPGFC